MTEPEISVVIPTKDRVGLLRRALASVTRQDQDLEVIVVDDGDGSGAAAARGAFSGRLTTLVSGRAGQVAARNLGISAASGRRIAFLDDDDWWDEPSHLARMLADSSPASGVVFASGRVVVEGGRPDAGAALPFGAAATPAGIRRDNQLLVSGVIYHRALHQELGLFDPDLPYYWDWDWYLRLFAAGVAFTASSSTAVRISAREDSVSALANQDARQANLMRLGAKHGLTGLVLKNHESIARAADTG